MADYFRRTVVLVVEHTPGGAFGLVLNRPSEATVGEAAPDLAELIGSQHVLHIGGPVQSNAVTAVGEHADRCRKQADRRRGGHGRPRRSARAGAASGSSPAIRAGAKGSSTTRSTKERILERALPRDPFGEGDLWAGVLERMGDEFALLARMPSDPSMN